MDEQQLKNIIEAALFAADQPMSLEQLLSLFEEHEKPSRFGLRKTIDILQDEYNTRGIELIEVASGFRIRVRQQMTQWITRLWEEKPGRYSKALMETLAIITYKQPVTRSEIEEIRGVSVSTAIIKTILERSWARIVGHRDVPGKPAMYGTTRQFLDYFNLKSLDDLPTLPELKNYDALESTLNKDLPT